MGTSLEEAGVLVCGLESERRMSGQCRVAELNVHIAGSNVLNHLSADFALPKGPWFVVSVWKPFQLIICD